MSQDQLFLQELLSDDYFIDWVLNPNEENDQYWTCWAQQNPAKAAGLAEARNLILLVKLQQPTPAGSEAAMVWDKIEAALRQADAQDRAATIKLEPETSWFAWFNYARKVAATLALLVLLASLGYLIFPHLRTADVQLALEKKVNPYGQQSSFRLPDGSKVFLNAGSSLQYPSDFEGQPQRLVHLQGEAFFEVVKDKRRAFVVKTQGLDVKVLGTRFNVKAYGEEDLIQITLVEGQVELSPKTAAAGLSQWEQPIRLLPNQKADFSKSYGKIARVRVDPHFYTSWREGKLLFKDTPLSEVVRILNRTYNVRIQIENKKLSQCSLTADLTHLPLSGTLEMMCRLVEARFRQNGNQILITGSGC